MKTDGFWTGEFAASNGSFGGGVLFLRGKVVLGGDAGYMYSGTLDFEGDVLRASIAAEAFLAGQENIFRTSQTGYMLDLEGRFVGDDQIVGLGSVRGRPDLQLSVRLTRREGIGS